MCGLFSEQFKAKAVKLVTEQGYSIAEATRSLKLSGNLSTLPVAENLLDRQFPSDANNGQCRRSSLG